MRTLIFTAATALVLSGTIASAQLANNAPANSQPVLPGAASTVPGSGNPAPAPATSELPLPPSERRANVPNGPGSAGTSSNPTLNATPTANGGFDPTKGVYAKDTPDPQTQKGSSGSSAPSDTLPTKKNINGDIDGDTGARGAAK